MKRCILIPLLLILFLITAGCKAGTVKIGMESDGKHIQLKKGQELSVGLEANPSTGYGWEIRETGGSVLRQKGEKEFKADSSLAGSGGTEMLHFYANTSGETALTLDYSRPWESVPPLKTFSVRVTVKD